MSTIPRMTFVMPLRWRVQFTTNALPTVLQHAERTDHEVIIVLDKIPLQYEIDRRGSEAFYTSLEKDQADRERVYRWIDRHKALLDEHKVRILECHGDRSYWSGGLRNVAALNMGVDKATTDWIVAVGDEDLILMPGWDRALWDVMQGRDATRHVAVPVMVMTHVHEAWPRPLTPEWIHAQRARCGHQLTFPMLPKHAEVLSCRVGLKSLADFARTAALPGVHEEICGERRIAHWVPYLIHRDLLRWAGGWPITPEVAGYDIRLDDMLGQMNVKKLVPSDHFVFHFKHHLRMDDATEAKWTEDEVAWATRGVELL